jgi:hypothetical protein
MNASAFALLLGVQVLRGDTIWFPTPVVDAVPSGARSAWILTADGGLWHLQGRPFWHLVRLPYSASDAVALAGSPQRIYLWDRSGAIVVLDSRGAVLRRIPFSSETGGMHFSIRYGLLVWSRFEIRELDPVTGAIHRRVRFSEAIRDVIRDESGRTYRLHPGVVVLEGRTGMDSLRIPVPLEVERIRMLPTGLLLVARNWSGCLSFSGSREIARIPGRILVAWPDGTVLIAAGERLYAFRQACSR